MRFSQITHHSRSQLLAFRNSDPARTYVFAGFITALILGLRLLSGDLAKDVPLLTLFIFPTALSALIGGFGPGMLATVLSGAGTCFFLLPPVHSFGIASGLDLLEWSLLMAAGLLVSLIGGLVHDDTVIDQKPHVPAAQPPSRFSELVTKFEVFYGLWARSVERSLELEGTPGPGHRDALEHSAVLLTKLKEMLLSLRYEVPRTDEDVQRLVRLIRLVVGNIRPGVETTSDTSDTLEAAAFECLGQVVIKYAATRSAARPRDTSRTASFSSRIGL